MTNKETAKLFLQMAGTGQVKKAFDELVAIDFIHHNQYFEGSCDALKTAMAEAHLSSPNKAIDLKYCYEDGATVITHSLVIKEDMEIAVVHIFRFESGKIVELWDLGQLIAKDSPNKNGLF